MADAHTARLCVELIHSHFGPLTAKIASVLLTRGRLSLSQIIRFTSLKPRIVRGALLVLVQHNILWHAQTEDEGEVMEVNTDECLMRLRFGKFVWQAEQLFGKAAAEIIQIILDYGKLRTPEIFSHLAIFDAKSIAVYGQTLHKLINGSYLKPATILSHISPRDKRIKYENEEKNKIPGFPTAKELRQAKEVAEARLKREEEEAEKVGLKRKAKESLSRPTKRKVVFEEDLIDHSVYFRVNYEKFNVHIRNTLFANTARERFNNGAALVIQSALKLTESSQLSLSDIRSEPVSVANIIMQLANQDGLSAGLVHSSKKVSNATCVKDYLGLLSSADNPTVSGKSASFISLASSKVQVEFEIIARRLRRRLLESIAREKHGTEGVRIIRLLMDMGKMDEKQISKVVMMAAKDVRPLLAALSADALISTQEVPRSADRNPTRTFYLWYVDLQKAYSAILGNVYKTLYNISMRRRVEEDENEVKVVLEKRQRSDVSQDETLLTRMERDILRKWELKQGKLAILEMRVEETVFILKDLVFSAVDDDEP